MSYVEHIQEQIEQKNFSKMMQLWEEFCTNDEIASDELVAILRTIKETEFAPHFGKYVEQFLPLLELFQESETRYQILQEMIDLQVTNSQELAETIFQALEARYGSDPQFKNWIRLIEVRPAKNFQGAISAYELLHHLHPGHFVFHPGGWGVGEVIEVAPFREQVTIEFENIGGLKHLPFTSAVKVLVPLDNDHFLARRFGDPDRFEREAKENPQAVIHLLLKDLGPKTAAEIKDALCDLVIPEGEWTKWWQQTRSRLKKDTLVHSSTSARDPFFLREKALEHEEKFLSELCRLNEPDQILQACYSFARDHGKILKQEEVKNSLNQAMQRVVDSEMASRVHRLQVHFFRETFFGEKGEIASFIKEVEDVVDLIDDIPILAFKKQLLISIREIRSDWSPLFLKLLFHVQQSNLREYLLESLQDPSTVKKLNEALDQLVYHPEHNPDLFFWYFNRVILDPKVKQETIYAATEAYLSLIAHIEHKQIYRNLTKKMGQLFLAKRYALPRKILEGSPIEFVREFLLLVSKCHLFTESQKANFQSLAAVVHPSIQEDKVEVDEIATLWATEEAFRKIQERVQHIATVEVIENAKEVEAARELGDLRENAEYKYAVERRANLQREMRSLSEQIKRARVLTKEDISTEEVGVGSVVKVEDSRGDVISYTILGPWDANPDDHVLSFQSRFVQSMVGKKQGEIFHFNDQDLKVLEIKSFL